MTRYLPVVAAIALAVVYVRFVRSAMSRDPAPQGPPQVLLHTFAAWTALPAIAGLGATFALGTGSVVGLFGLLAIAAAFVLLVPWPTATMLAIPRGWVKPAYMFSRLSTLKSHPDPIGVAMAAAARALLRHPAPGPGLATWIQAHGDGRPITPGTVLAHGLLAAHRGDDGLAQRLLALVESFDRPSQDDVVLRWSREWRAAEAAERGAWSEVVQAATTLGPTSPVTRWLEGVGRRYGEVPDAPSDETLDARWQQIPTRRKLSDLHHACLGHRHGYAPEGQAAGDPLQAHVDFLAHPTPPRLVGAITAWAAVANDPTHRPRLARAVGDLQAAAAEAGLRMPPLPTSLQAHLGDADDDLLRPLELAGQRLSHRLEQPGVDPLACLFDWMDLASLLDDVRRQGSPLALRMAFRPAHAPLTSLSVALYNDLGQPQLSNALTRWLLVLAREVGDERAVELQTRNLAATSAVP